MKQYFLIILCFLASLQITSAQKALQDSLREVVKNSQTPDEKLKAMTNLMDAAARDEILPYALNLYEEVRNTDNLHYKEIALTEILRHYINKDIKDTANYYMGIAEKELKGRYKECLLAYMQAIMDTRVVYYTESEEGKKLIESHLLKLKTKKNMSDIEKMATNYVLGMSLSNKVRPDDQEDQFKEIKDYFNNTARLGEKMPLEFGILFLPNTYFILCTYNTDNKTRADYALRYLRLLTDYTLQEERPHTLRRQFLTVYSILAGLPDALGKEQAGYYYQKFQEYLKLHPDAANVTPLYEYLSTSIQFYKALRDYKRVISLNDSLISFFRSMPDFDKYAVLTMKENIALYDTLHMYKEAYETTKECEVLLDSARVKNEEDKLANLEIQKNVNQLIVEKTALELEVEKQKANVYLFLALFLLAICIGVYVIFRLGKIKALYRELQESNRLVIIASEKAQESEKMKNAFIKNMCHEVRTPLNAINGFSELITNDGTTAEEKQEFSKIIFNNCTQLTSMMDDVLQIAQLDSTRDTLPLAPTHLHTLCQHEIEMLKLHQRKEGIEYMVEGNKAQETAYTNQTYFTLIITHLLNNANKFTRKGSIVLAYEADPEHNVMTVSVTDTGCGIPADKHEWIFERFTKHDDFIPGSGLGLYLCRLTAEHLKGKISVDTTYTNGARFVLTIPLEAE